MSGSQHEDYLTRQVRAIAAMLARMVGLRTSGEDAEAKAELAKAYGLLFGPQAELLRRVDTRTVATLLNSEDRILALAQLFNEEAEQDKDVTQSKTWRVRAVELGIEVTRRDPENETARHFLKALAPVVDRQQLTPQQRAILDESLGLPST